MCRVLNKHRAGVPAGAVYIGRGSKWGNPFRIGPDGNHPKCECAGGYSRHQLEFRQHWSN